MANRELRRLNRIELIDIIYELQKENNKKDALIQNLQTSLNERTLRISNAGSIAEAAMSLNGVFEAAQAAADQYLASVKAATADAEQILADAEEKRQKILSDAEKEAADIISGLRAQGSGLRAQGSGLRAQGSGLRAQGVAASLDAEDLSEEEPDNEGHIPAHMKPRDPMEGGGK